MGPSGLWGARLLELLYTSHSESHRSRRRVKAVDLYSTAFRESVQSARLLKCCVSGCGSAVRAASDSETVCVCEVRVPSRARMETGALPCDRTVRAPPDPCHNQLKVIIESGNDPRYTGIIA